MKNAIFLFLLSILVFSCEKDEPFFTDEKLTIDQRSNNKMDICHYDAETDTWKTININVNAWPAHEAHGDTDAACTETLGCEELECLWCEQLDLMNFGPEDFYCNYYEKWESEYYEYTSEIYFLEIRKEDESSFKAVTVYSWIDNWYGEIYQGGNSDFQIHDYTNEFYEGCNRGGNGEKAFNYASVCYEWLTNYAEELGMTDQCTSEDEQGIMPESEVLPEKLKKLHEKLRDKATAH